jgi:RNA polymerase primary sigma factor
MVSNHHKESASYKVSAEDGALALYLKEISKYKALPIDEEAKLAVLIRNGDDAALDKLVRSNLRFVVSVSRMPQSALVASLSIN